MADSRRCPACDGGDHVAAGHRLWLARLLIPRDETLLTGHPLTGAQAFFQSERLRTGLPGPYWVLATESAANAPGSQPTASVGGGRSLPNSGL